MISEPKPVALLYLKDFTENGGDRYFLFDGDAVREVGARSIANSAAKIITHDYGLIAPSIRAQAGQLPECVIDILDFYRGTCALTGKDGRIQSRTLEELLHEQPVNYDATKYGEVFYRRVDYSETIYAEAGNAILRLWADLCRRAVEGDEIERYMQIEAPVFNLVWSSISAGISIDRERLRAHKESARDAFYLNLRDFAIRFSLPIEVPSPSSVDRELEARGFDIDEGDRDYILEFLPMPDEFGDRLSELLKAHRTLNTLNQLPSSKALAFPLADIAGTRTSRILFRTPALQNLSRRHRDIVCARIGKQLYYLDYCQFEPGIMAALSNDPYLLQLYEAGDLYDEISLQLFKTKDSRKIEKKLFLSYSYGMNLKKIADAANASGADRKAASKFFRQFSVFERWKDGVTKKYQELGKVGTTLGNYSRRAAQGDLSAKEKRSCISQVVQGTGSLIFKKALLGMNKELGIVPLIPMHDAILFESNDACIAPRAKLVMERVFCEHFKGRTRGRVELASFGET